MQQTIQTFLYQLIFCFNVTFVFDITKIEYSWYENKIIKIKKDRSFTQQWDFFRFQSNLLIFDAQYSNIAIQRSKIVAEAYIRLAISSNSHLLWVSFPAENALSLYIYHFHRWTVFQRKFPLIAKQEKN